MAAVGYASRGRFGMDDFPFDRSSSPSPFDLSDYIMFDEGPVQCPLPVSSTGTVDPGQPPQGQFLISSSSTAAAGGQFSMTTNQFASSTSSTAAAAGQFSMASQPAGSSSSRSNSVEGGGGGVRVAFRTKTEVDVLDDGFKWRKYGKKSVKNSPNPRRTAGPPVYVAKPPLLRPLYLRSANGVAPRGGGLVRAQTRNYYRCSTEGCSVKKRVERDRDNPSYVITSYDGVHNHTSADVVYYATQDSASGQFVVSGSYRNMPPNSAA